VPLSDLSTILWQERRLVGLLRDGASARFALHSAELERAVVVHELAQELHLGQDVTLRDLVGELPAPWPHVFKDHLTALASAGDDALPRSLADFLR
jgi:hypothetical protein